jgi:Sec-independent protein secretion pathway component TatC
MVAMLIPLLVLYEVSIPIARLVQPKPEGAAGSKDADDLAAGTT